MKEIYLCMNWFQQITTYLGKRDFVDHLEHIDPVGKFSLLLILWHWVITTIPLGHMGHLGLTVLHLIKVYAQTATSDMDKFMRNSWLEKTLTFPTILSLRIHCFRGS